MGERERERDPEMLFSFFCVDLLRFFFSFAQVNSFFFQCAEGGLALA